MLVKFAGLDRALPTLNLGFCEASHEYSAKVEGSWCIVYLEILLLVLLLLRTRAHIDSVGLGSVLKPEV